MKTKILIISPFFSPHIGGSQRYMEELAVRMMKVRRDVHFDVLSYNTTNSKAKEKYRGMNIYRIPCFQVIPGQFILPNPIVLLQTLRELSKNGYQIIHSNTRFFESSWWAWLYAKTINARSIITDHIAGHPVNHNVFVNLIAKLIDQSVSKWILEKYDLITVTNQATYNFLTHVLKVKNNITIQYGGVDTSFYKPINKTSRRTIPKIKKIFNNHDFIITFSGRLIWTKGLTYLTYAIKQILSKHPKNVYFVIAGSGDLDKWLIKFIKDNKFHNRVFMLGPQNSFQVRNILRASDIFIHPSHHTEGFPNAILEAGSCGDFVIATDNAGTKEIITSKKTGILIQPKNSLKIVSAINWAINNRSKRIRMANELRNIIVRKFDWNKLAVNFYNYSVKYNIIPKSKFQFEYNFR